MVPKIECFCRKFLRDFKNPAYVGHKRQDRKFERSYKINKRARGAANRLLVGKN